MKDDRPSIRSSNPTNYPPKAPKPRKVYGDSTPYEVIVVSKRKYDNLIIGLFTGWLFFGITFIYLIFALK